MATNPQADGQAKISFQISEEEKAALQKLADASKMKLSAYIRLVLTEAIEQRRIYRPVVYSFGETPEQAVAEEQEPYGTAADVTAAAKAALASRPAPPTAPGKTPTGPAKDTGPKNPQ